MNRSFQATWFNKLAWLHYDVMQDASRCFTCCKAVKDGRAVDTGGYYLGSDGSRFNLRACNLQKFPGGGMPQTPLDKCTLHTKHPEPEAVDS